MVGGNTVVDIEPAPATAAPVLSKPPRRLLLWISFPIVVLVTLAGLVIVFGRPFLETRTVPTGIVVLRGIVETSSSGDTTTVIAGSTVGPGTVVRTGKTSEVALHFADGTSVRLAPESELRVSEAFEELRAPGLTTALLTAVGLVRDAPQEPTVDVFTSAELLRGKALVQVPELGQGHAALVVRAGQVLASASKALFQIDVDPFGGARVRSISGEPVVYTIGQSGSSIAGLLAGVPPEHSTEITGSTNGNGQAQLEAWFSRGATLVRESVQRRQLHVSTSELSAIGRVSETGAILYAQVEGAKPGVDDLRKIAAVLDLPEATDDSVAFDNDTDLAGWFVRRIVTQEAFRANLPWFLDLRPLGGNVIWAVTPLSSGPLWLGIDNTGRLTVDGLPPGVHFPGVPGAFVQVAGLADAIQVVYAPSPGAT